MKSLKVLFVFVFLFGGVLSACGHAQEESSDEMSTDDQWQETIDRVTRETTSLLTENEKLNLEYEFLKDKSANLKAELEKTQAEVKELQSAKKKTKKT